MKNSNKKVKNAEVTEINGIKFKSKLEARAYEYLLTLNYPIDYEVEKTVLIKSFKPNGYRIEPNKGILSFRNDVVRGITYTPDFILHHPKARVFIETKGFKTDSYNIKKKLFLDLYKEDEKFVFAEIHSIRQLKYLIEHLLDEIT